MEGKVRVSIMALLAANMTYDDIQPFIRENLGPDSDREYRRLYASADCEGESQRLQVKYSRVIDARDLDEAAFLRVANAFRDAGYGDVAWKITPIAPDDPDPESTTASFPVELFQSCLEEEALEDEAGMDIPPEPFGSEAFWKWFDEADN
ncbi:MAG: hypothetical protein QNJ01_06005 [Desulfobacterales bacterium]|nr:hypothetical protein [Desulfobacterales bacterium]